jgi:uncharacterized protein YqfA (UPF0365 family)
MNEFKEYFFMVMRNSPVRRIKSNRSKLKLAGLDVSASQLELHHLSGGSEVTE